MPGLFGKFNVELEVFSYSIKIGLSLSVLHENTVLYNFLKREQHLIVER